MPRIPLPSHDPSLAGASGLAPLPTGWAALDRLLHGGWPVGVLSEISGRGRASLALEAVRQAQARGQPVAWVDGPGSFCPPTAGVDLARLALICPARAASECVAGPESTPAPEDTPARARTRTSAHERPHARACLAADLLLRSRAFGLLVLDLPACRPSLAICFRLARQAAAAQGVLLLLSAGRAPVAGSAAGLLLAVRQRHARCARWMLPPPPALQVTVLRQRGAPACGAAGACVVLPPCGVR